MKQFDQKWQKLTALARQAPTEDDAPAPFGFATRTAALAMAAPSPRLGAVFGRLALRGLLAAAAFSVAAVVFDFTALAGSQDDETGVDDTISQVLDLS